MADAERLLEAGELLAKVREEHEIQHGLMLKFAEDEWLNRDDWYEYRRSREESRRLLDQVHDIMVGAGIDS